MWAIPQWAVEPREDPEVRDERLLRLYDQQIQELEACSNNTPYWDGYCGLVKACDEDAVRSDLVQPGSPQGRQPPLPTAAPPQQQLAAAHRPGQPSSTPPVRGSPRGAAGTPPGGSPLASPAASPLKPGPGATPRTRQPAAVLVEQAAALVHTAGRLGDAEALLHDALARCAASDTQLAGRVVDLLLEAESQRRETPSHSRAGSADVELGGGDGGLADSRADGGEAAAALRHAIDALAAGRERAAEQLLRGGLAACPPEQPELRRRLELYHELLASKGAV